MIYNVKQLLIILVLGSVPKPNLCRSQTFTEKTTSSSYRNDLHQNYFNPLQRLFFRLLPIGLLIYLWFKSTHSPDQPAYSEQSIGIFNVTKLKDFRKRDQHLSTRLLKPCYLCLVTNINFAVVYF